MLARRVPGRRVMVVTAIGLVDVEDESVGLDGGERFVGAWTGPSRWFFVLQQQ